jgi:hypothetical protein
VQRKRKVNVLRITQTSISISISADPKVKEELSPVVQAARKSLPKDVVEEIQKGNLKPFLKHIKTIASDSDIG